MLCNNCRRQTATTDDGRCADCLMSRTGEGTVSTGWGKPGLTPIVKAPTPTQAPGVMRSPVGLGRAVIVLLGLVVLTDLAAIGAELNMRSLYAPLVDGDHTAYTTTAAERADRFMYLSTSLQVMAELATIVVFIIWFHRVRTNADVLAHSVFTRGPGWAIGGWFIPIANLWIPRRIAIQIWTASRAHPYEGAAHEPCTPVNMWWAGFITTWLVARAAGRQYTAAQDAEEIVSAVEMLVASESVDIAAAVLTMLFVHRLTGMQRARAAEGTATRETGQPSDVETPGGKTTPVPPMPQ